MLFGWRSKRARVSSPRSNPPLRASAPPPHRGGDPLGPRLLPDEEEGAPWTPLPAKHSVAEERTAVEAEIVRRERARGTRAVRVHEEAVGRRPSNGSDLRVAAEAEGTRRHELHQLPVVAGRDQGLDEELEGEPLREGRAEPGLKRHRGLVERREDVAAAEGGVRERIRDARNVLSRGVGSRQLRADREVESLSEARGEGHAGLP